MFSKVRDYIKDEEFRLVLFNDRIYAVNYKDILSLESERISFKVDDGRIVVKGKDLTLNKLLEKEVLIGGEVLNIEVSHD